MILKEVIHQVYDNPKLKKILIFFDKFFFDHSVGITSRWFRHLVAGGIGTLGYMFLVAFFVEILSIYPVYATVIAFSISVLYSYIINRKWVHNATSDHGYTLPRYVVVTVNALILNAGIMYLVVEIFDWWYVMGVVCATAVVPPTNFLLNYFWAFKKKE